MYISFMHVMSAMHGYNMLSLTSVAVNMAFGAPKMKFIASAENIILWHAL